MRARIRACGFHPDVFKKARKDIKAKGVDIALSRDLLGHAYKNNYDVAILLSGDGDYVPLVEEVQRLGKRICVAFLDGEWVNPSLKTIADEFIDITSFFSAPWAQARCSR